MTKEDEKMITLLLNIPKSWNNRLTAIMKKQGKIKKATLELLIMEFIEMEEKRLEKGRDYIITENKSQ